VKKNCRYNRKLDVREEKNKKKIRKKLLDAMVTLRLKFNFSHSVV